MDDSNDEPRGTASEPLAWVRFCLCRPLARGLHDVPPPLSQFDLEVVPDALMICCSCKMMPPSLIIHIQGSRLELL